MSDDFFRTRMGQQFYDVSVPGIQRALESIAESLEKVANPVQTIHIPENLEYAAVDPGGALADVFADNWTINRVPVVSTAHITAADDQALRNAYDSPDPWVSEVEGGWLIFLGGEHFDSEFWERTLSPEAADILLAASVSGAQYIRFDKDGPVYHRFPTFEW